MGSGIKSLLPLLLLGGGLGGKGGKGGLGGNPLLLTLLLGKNCKDPHDCVKHNTQNNLCGDKPNYISAVYALEVMVCSVREQAIEIYPLSWLKYTILFQKKKKKKKKKVLALIPLL